MKSDADGCSCEQGAVVGGVYRRDALSPSQCRSPRAPSHSQSVVGAITNIASGTDDYSSCVQTAEAAELGDQYVSFQSPRAHPSVTVASPHTTTTPVSAATSASTECATSQLYAGLCPTSQVAIQPPLPAAHVYSVSLVPQKAGVLPPAANVNVNSSSAASDVSDASQPCVDKSAVESVTQPESSWKEFEEALSEEFVTSTMADSSHQTKDVVSSSYLLQPPKPQDTMMLSKYCIFFTLSS